MNKYKGKQTKQADNEKREMRHYLLSEQVFSRGFRTESSLINLLLRPAEKPSGFTLWFLKFRSQFHFEQTQTTLFIHHQRKVFWKELRKRETWLTVSLVKQRQSWLKVYTTTVIIYTRKTTSWGPESNSLTRWTTTGRRMARHSGRRKSGLCTTSLRVIIFWLLRRPLGTLLIISAKAVLYQRKKDSYIIDNN